MKIAHLIRIKVFSYEKFNENEKLILGKFLQLFPFNIKDEKIELKKIKKVCEKNNVLKIVLGIPLGYKAKSDLTEKAVQNFKLQIQKERK